MTIELGVAVEIATYMTWNNDTTVVLWVPHNEYRKLFRDSIIDYLSRDFYVPGLGMYFPPPAVTYKDIYGFGLANSARLRIFSIKSPSSGRGLSVTRAYVPKHGPHKVVDELLTSIVPALSWQNGSLIRY